MTRYEKYFYNVLVELKDELNIEVMPQVNINDNTHNYSDRRNRDIKVDKAGIKLIKFYSNYPNKKIMLKSELEKKLRI